MALTAKQIKFCQEYTIDLNATKAAKRAGYKIKSAKSIGSENLTKPDILEYISELNEQTASELQITKQKVLDGYRKLAFYDPRKFYDDKGELIPVLELDGDTAFALAGFEVTEEWAEDEKTKKRFVVGQTKKIKMSDRRGALDGIAKMLGYNAPTKVANTNKDGEDVITPYTDAQVNKILKTLRENKST